MLETSAVGGCFYCQRTFSTNAIADWVDEDNAAGATALCPHCGIDSVIPELADYPLTPDLLASMHAYWFERTVRMSAHPSFLERIRLRYEPALRRLIWDWKARRHRGK